MMSNKVIGVLDTEGFLKDKFFSTFDIKKINLVEECEKIRENENTFSHAENVCAAILKENPECRIILVSIVNKKMKSSKDKLLQGLKILIAKKVDYINLSLGIEKNYDKDIENLCLEAKMKGIQIIAAYNNQTNNKTVPACLTSVLGIRTIFNKDMNKKSFYDSKKNDLIFTCNYLNTFFLNGQPIVEGNSIKCAQVVGILSALGKENYSQYYLQSYINQCCTDDYMNCNIDFFSNRKEDILQKKFISEIVCTNNVYDIQELEHFLTVTKKVYKIFLDVNEFSFRDEEKILGILSKHFQNKIVYVRYPIFSVINRIKLWEKKRIVVKCLY